MHRKNIKILELKNIAFDIIFLDIDMPVLDGYGTLKKIIQLEENNLITLKQNINFISASIDDKTIKYGTKEDIE